MSTFDWLTATPIAHRALHDGNKTRYENSLSAFGAAADAGFAIECDLHISSDGVPIVFHDWTLDRLTNETGLVRDRSAKELRKIKLGSSTDAIYPLAEHLDLVAGRVPVVLELKGIEGHDEGFVAAVAKVLETYQGDVAVMAFEHWLVKDMSSLIGHRPRGLTAKGGDEKYDIHMQAVRDYAVDFIAYDVRELPCDFIKDCRLKRNLPVITWTVRDEKQERLTKRYADQITFELYDPR